MTYKIFGFNTFNVAKVLLTAEELGIEYEWVELDAAKGEHQSEQHKRRHPLGKVPVLEHEGQFFIESASICRYLARVNGGKLYSQDPVRAARIDQTMDLMGYHVGRWLAVYFWQEVIQSKFFGKPPEADAIIEAEGFLQKILPVVEHQLSQSSFFVGDQLSLADTFGFAYFQLQETTSIDLTPYPNIMTWYQAFKARPSVAKVNALLAG